MKGSIFSRATLVTAAVLSLQLMGVSLHAQQSDDAPVLFIPDGYVYDASGRRDPFVNPVPAPPPAASGPTIPDRRPPGLPGVLLNEASLSGVVNAYEGDSIVVVEAPGSRTFIAREGDELLDVVIREIRSDSVIFEVKPVDGSPEPVERERVVRNVNAAPGE